MDVAAAERALGLRFPPFLARVYTEVGDGGFGPGEGLVPLARLVREALALRTGEPLPRGRTWPRNLITVVERDPGWTCVDVETGAVIDWDPEDLEEHSSEARFQRSFETRSPSVEVWLAKWVGSKTAADRNKPSQHERWARMQARAQSPKGQAWQARKTRAAIEQLSPEERERWGLDAFLVDDEEPEPPAQPQPTEETRPPEGER